MKLEINGSRVTVTVARQLTGSDLRQQLEAEQALKPEDYYLISNGKPVHNDHVISNGCIHIVQRLLGGKGGFGSMLRAIGAQIEKTTNREACRDLSGRRLRDINEEQRLKNWINNQAEREKEAKEKKKKKLERLCEMPKHEFKDEEYDKERSVLPEMIEDAVLQGIQASSSSKRKTSEVTEIVKSKKQKMWLGDELDDLSSDDSEEELTKEGTDKKNKAVDENEKNSGDDSRKSIHTINEELENKSDEPDEHRLNSNRTCD